jgi:hypothetical protein
MEVKPNPPQIGGPSLTLVRPWNIIHKLPLRIPHQDFIHFHFLGPSGLQALCKMNFYFHNTFLPIIFLYFDGHGLSIFSIKRASQWWCENRFELVWSKFFNYLNKFIKWACKVLYIKIVLDHIRYQYQKIQKIFWITYYHFNYQIINLGN